MKRPFTAWLFLRIRAYHSDIAETPLASVQDLNSNDRKYAYVVWLSDDGKHLTLLGVSGADEEIMEWCFEKGRRLNEGDIMIWNSFNSKLGWKDFATPMLEEAMQKHGITDRTDIETIGDVIDFDEGRRS